jgi:hypothetical protein
MLKILAAALAVTGAVWFSAPAPANATTSQTGISKATQIDMSAARRHRRSARVYRYPYASPYPNGYYGPTYYDRPYYRPAPLFFGIGGWW